MQAPAERRRSLRSLPVRPALSEAASGIHVRRRENPAGRRASRGRRAARCAITTRLWDFAALMSITVSINAVSAARANTSAVGARRQVSGVSHREAIGRSPWLRVSSRYSSCLLLAFRLYAASCWAWNSVDAMGWRCLRIAACALMSTGVGRGNWGAFRTCSIAGQNGHRDGHHLFLCALFAGLYGEPSMQLADRDVAKCALGCARSTLRRRRQTRSTI